MNKMTHRLTTVMLSLTMALALFAAPAFVPAAAGARTASAATTFSDINGHWAKNYIQKAVTLGIVNGYSDGTFRPDQDVTRAEFTKMINTALGNNGMVDVDFSDVVAGQWFCADVCKGVAAAFITGYSDGTFLPDNTISRQEAAVILARIIPAAGAGQSVSAYNDAADVAEWAVPSMEKIVGKKYMTGAYNELTPTASLTRGQAAKIVVELSEGEKIIKKNQTIIKDGITIKDTIYANQISVGSQVEDGTSTFDNSVVLGNINVVGGGSKEGAGVLLKDSRAAKLTVARSEGTVRVTSTGESTIVNTCVDESAFLQGDGNSIIRGDFGRGFVNVYMNRKSDLTLNGALSGALEKLVCQGAKCDATILKGSAVSQMLITRDAPRCSVDLEEGSSADTVNVYGANTVLEGKGSVNILNVYADGLSYDMNPKTVTVDSSVNIRPVQNIDPSVSLMITPSPSDGEKDVPVDEQIELKFTSAVHATGSNDSVLTDIQAASLIQLKKGDAAGPNVPFTAKVINNGKAVTITPDEALDSETAYYIRIAKEDLTDEYDNKNELFLSGFTTEKAVAPVITPEPQPQPGAEQDEAGQDPTGEQDGVI